MGCLLRVKSLISYSVSITTVLHTIWGLYSSALWRHSTMCTNCTALNGKKFLLTSGKRNMHWQYCRWDATKHYKIRECFSMAMSKDLLCFANKFRCIQSCDILHMQNIACLYNHWRLIVNILNKRFLILILIHPTTTRDQGPLEHLPDDCVIGLSRSVHFVKRLVSLNLSIIYVSAHICLNLTKGFEPVQWLWCWGSPIWWIWLWWTWYVRPPGDTWYLTQPPLFAESK